MPQAKDRHSLYPSLWFILSWVIESCVKYNLARRFFTLFIKNLENKIFENINT